MVKRFAIFIYKNVALGEVMMWRHLLVGDDLEDQVVQQGELLRYLQCRVTLKGLGLSCSNLKDTENRLKAT